MGYQYYFIIHSLYKRLFIYVNGRATTISTFVFGKKNIMVEVTGEHDTAVQEEEILTGGNYDRSD
jgi:hypothetical protein